MSLIRKDDITLEQRFDGPIPSYLTETDASRHLAERGKLSMLERMMGEYLDEAERLERAIDEGAAKVRDNEATSMDANRLEIDRARYTAALRSTAWAMKAVAVHRKHLGMAPHPIMAAVALKQAAE